MWVRSIYPRTLSLPFLHQGSRLPKLKIKLQELKNRNQQFYDIPIYINIFIYIGIS